MDTASYTRFADGAFLTSSAMAWFWTAYAPDAKVRSEITASLLRSAAEDLTGLAAGVSDRG